MNAQDRTLQTVTGAPFCLGRSFCGRQVYFWTAARRRSRGATWSIIAPPFTEISKNWAAEPLDSYQKILNLIRTTSTQNGPAVSAYLDRRHHQTGDPPDPDLFRQLRLTGANTLPDWNYTIATQT